MAEGIQINNLPLFFYWKEDFIRRSTNMDTCSALMDINCYAHSLRHYYATYLAKSNIPLDVIADIVGHESSSTTKIYNDTPKEDGFLKYFSEDGIQTVEQKKLSEL